MCAGALSSRVAVWSAMARSSFLPGERTFWNCCHAPTRYFQQSDENCPHCGKLSPARLDAFGRDVDFRYVDDANWAQLLAAHSLETAPGRRRPRLFPERVLTPRLPARHSSAQCSPNADVTSELFLVQSIALSVYLNEGLR